MNLLTLNDLELGLADLLTKRVDVLTSCANGRLYQPGLHSQLKAIQALPAALVSTLPFAEKLAQTDTNHDAFGAAIWHLCEAYQRLATLEPALAEQAGVVQDTFVPTLGALKVPFADEAMAAKDRRASLAEHKSLLASFPVANNKTLEDWAVAYLDHGEQLDALLSERAKEVAETTSDRSNAAPLRGQTIGMLGRFRAALADEIAMDSSLPRDLDAQIFGYFDELHRRRGTSGGSGPQPS